MCDATKPFMKQRLRAWLPTAQSIRDNRWLRWMGPALHHPRLWHFSRKGISLGLALGIFFGLLIPVAQIPLSAAAAVVFRANLPMAVASTLVTNPVTFGPVYFAAYQLGQFVLGQDGAAAKEAPVASEVITPEAGWWQRLQALWTWLTSVGKPLVVGLGILAVACGLLAYGLTSGIWAWRTRWQRRQRLNQRTQD
jgi:uncharacterized protein (DUF2062 family)